MRRAAAHAAAIRTYLGGHSLDFALADLMVPSPRFLEGALS